MPRQNVAAAAPAWARDILSNTSAGKATVIHAGADAIYLDAGTDVIALVSRDAIKVPCALQTTLSSMEQLEQGVPAPGTRVEITDGTLRLSRTDVTIGRVIDYSAPAINTDEAPAMASRLAGVSVPALADIRSELPADAIEALQEASPVAVDALVGLGSGLTPLGDDVLCGWIAALVAAKHACAELAASRILACADERTTSLSATLLRRAVAGDAVRQFADLVRVLASPDSPKFGRESSPESIATVTHALAGIGHTSGAGLLLGLSIALNHLARRSYCP